MDASEEQELRKLIDTMQSSKDKSAGQSTTSTSSTTVKIVVTRHDAEASDGARKGADDAASAGGSRSPKLPPRSPDMKPLKVAPPEASPTGRRSPDVGGPGISPTGGRLSGVASPGSISPGSSGIASPGVASPGMSPAMSPGAPGMSPSPGGYSGLGTPRGMAFPASPDSSCRSPSGLHSPDRRDGSVSPSMSPKMVVKVRKAGMPDNSDDDLDQPETKRERPAGKGEDTHSIDSKQDEQAAQGSLR